MKNSNYKRKQIIMNLLIILFTIILIVSVIFFIYTFYNHDISKNIEDWSSFGGYIGGVLGFIATLISISYIYLTYNNQVHMSYKTQFESIFFEMLRTQRYIYNEVNQTIHFSILRMKLEEHFQVDFGIKDLKIYEWEILMKTYYGYHIEGQPILHYFRHLYHIIKYVLNDEYLSNEEEKKKYMDMIQAEMNDNELFITLFNAVWYSNKIYLNSLDQYSFFENMQSDGSWFDYMKKNLFPKTKWKHFTNDQPLNIDDIDFEGDFEKEGWFETLDRYNKKYKDCKMP